MNSNLTRATVVYLVDNDNRVCLARMKKAIHKDKEGGGDQEQGSIEYSLGVWNGYGGKELPEDIERATAGNVDDNMLFTATRELQEESGVKADVKDLEPIGVVNFYLKVKSDMPFMQVYFYILRKWENVPMESKEMGPATFFDKEYIPYHEMMPADKMLFEKMLNGESIDSDIILMGKDVEPIVKFVL